MVNDEDLGDKYIFIELHWWQGYSEARLNDLGEVAEGKGVDVCMGSALYIICCTAGRSFWLSFRVGSNQCEDWIDMDIVCHLQAARIAMTATWSMERAVLPHHRNGPKGRHFPVGFIPQALQHYEQACKNPVSGSRGCLVRWSSKKRAIGWHFDR